MDPEKPPYSASGADMNDSTDWIIQTENKLTLFEYIVNTSKDAVCVIYNMRIIYVNAAFLTLYGYKNTSELKGKGLQDLILSSELSRFNSLLQEIQQDQNHRRLETIGVGKSGKTIDLQFDVNYMPDNGKDIFILSVKDPQELQSVRQRLLDTNEKFSTAFYKSSIAKSITTFPEGEICDVNNSFEELSGYTLQEIRGKTSTEINIWTNPADREKFSDMIRNNSPVRNQEIQFRNKTGEIGTYLLSSEIILIQGEMYLLSNFIDIRYQKRVEEKLKESELRWQFSVDGSGLGLWDWNLETNEVFFSEQWKKMLGYEDHEIRNNLEEWDKRLHPEDRDKAYHDIDLHVKGINTVYYNEHRLKCKNGTYKWIQDRGKILFRSAEGKPLRMIGTHTDIDLQKKIQEEFNENLAKFRLLFEQSPLGIYIANKAGDILEGNDRLLELLGSPSLEATKQINVLSFPTLVENGYSDIYKKCIDTGENQYIEMKYNSRWGKQSYLASYIVPLYNTGNELKYVFTLMEDITERKEAEIELHKSNVTKDKLFSIIAHDLRGPIGTMLNISEVLSQKNLTNEETRQKFLEAQRDMSQYTFYLLDNLLNWARLNSHQIKIKPKILNIKTLIEQNITSIQYKAKTKSIEIRSILPENLEVFVDEDMMKLVLRNLFENAVKFTPVQGRITIEAMSSGKLVNLTIMNSGSAISSKVVRKILSDSEFYSTSGTNKEKGTGLGLKLVKEFIDQNNGKFIIEGKHKEGTLVKLTLPAPL